mmetsp:Transcript_19551/g.53828  ORF Transcript_19551/g.53828 Transcript_19551/m.53828 type:complete len:673 (-) Transcript_19551:32-2050(-)
MAQWNWRLGVSSWSSSPARLRPWRISTRFLSEQPFNLQEHHLQLQLVQERITNILLEEKGVACEGSRLMQKYKERYQTRIEYKILGYKSLKNVLDTMPAVEQYTFKGSGMHVKLRNGTLSPSLDTLDEFEFDTTPSSETGSSPTRENSSSPQPTIFTGFLDFATRGREQQRRQQQQRIASESSINADENDEPLASMTSSIHPAVHNPMLLSIANSAEAQHLEEKALLGCTDDGYSMENVYLNTHAPFCSVAVGVQGAGKSHTLNCLLESCLLQSEELDQQDKIRLKRPMTTMVLHYDQNPTAVCEAAGLLASATTIADSSSEPQQQHLAKEKAVVLVSPTYYHQRKEFYGDFCDVRPLLFQWNSLTADHIKRIMQVNPEANQLYVASFMRLLRGHQRSGTMPGFDEFMKEIGDICSLKGQSGPLNQRIALLESVVAESSVNRDIRAESMDLSSAMQSDTQLIIVDLTDPLLSKAEANSLFQVVTEQFRTIPTAGGKMLALDEAHKFMDGVQSDGLSEAIVNVARLMRHDGIRLAVSTQSPKALAPELLELVTVAFLHHFHSRDWWDYLRKKLPLEDHCFTDQVLQLPPGNALVFASKHNFDSEQQGGGGLEVRIRRRLTADFGATRTNRSNHVAPNSSTTSSSAAIGAKMESKTSPEMAHDNGKPRGWSFWT